MCFLLFAAYMYVAAYSLKTYYQVRHGPSSITKTSVQLQFFCLSQLEYVKQT